MTNTNTANSEMMDLINKVTAASKEKSLEVLNLVDARVAQLLATFTLNHEIFVDLFLYNHSDITKVDKLDLAIFITQSIKVIFRVNLSVEEFVSLMNYADNRILKIIAKQNKEKDLSIEEKMMARLDRTKLIDIVSTICMLTSMSNYSALKILAQDRIKYLPYLINKSFPSAYLTLKTLLDKLSGVR